MKWWQALLNLAGDFSGLGVGLCFCLFERGETLDAELLRQLSAEMALKKVSQHPRVKRSKNNVFPLPQFWSLNFSEFDSCGGLEEVLNNKPFVARFAVPCWCSLATLFCNDLANEGFKFGSGEPLAPQRDLLMAIQKSVERIVNDDVCVDWSLSDVLSDFERRTVSYSGEEVCLSL